MKNNLTTQFIDFDINDLFSKNDFKNEVVYFFLWFTFSASFVIWSNTYYPDVVSYQEAIQEGMISSNLWSALGSMGFFVAGMAIAFSKFTKLRKSAKALLDSSYSVGCLSLGLMAGQVFVLVKTDGLIWWQTTIYATVISISLTILIGVNFMIRLFGYLIQNKEGEKSLFLKKLEAMHWLWCVTLGLGTSLLTATLFLLEK